MPGLGYLHVFREGFPHYRTCSIQLNRIQGGNWQKLVYSLCSPSSLFHLGEWAPYFQVLAGRKGEGTQGEKNPTSLYSPTSDPVLLSEVFPNQAIAF